MGPSKWTYFYLYVILDIFSRYVVGWMLAPHESAALAEHLIGETCAKHGIQPGPLTLHADRGSSMKSKPVALWLADLGVTKTHSRPHVSNDNPFSEAQCKTLKYWPQFPERFGSLEDGRAFGQVFFPWYNQEHRHSGLGFLTPAVVHFGQAPTVRAQRQQVLAAADAAHPERFVKGRSQPADLPRAVWINPPAKNTAAQDAPGNNDRHHGRPPSRPESRRRRPCRRHDRRPHRDSNYCALGVSMSLTASALPWANHTSMKRRSQKQQHPTRLP